MQATLSTPWRKEEIQMQTAVNKAQLSVDESWAVELFSFTCVIRNLVSLSGSRPFSEDKIISSMSP